ncbi:hypothetical protein [Arthrobacter sp. ISL-95]|uniref:hypothetical protein n=1 Tax=Arthrobacter sp. ISL-95 TaxID=2819116 RepID=UPI001BE96C02|nr:hypothetical protein [Arthrobacter sp. ISL-95]MBT2587986.1 hypothetical protein [Arthrobacter sp. ISL-95]
MDNGKRLGAQSRCWIAPVGTRLDEAGWKPLGFISLDGFATPEQQAADAREKYCIPQRFLAGMAPNSIELTMADLSPEALELYYGSPATRAVLGNESPNERSKPLGLTKDHKYTDSDGDAIEVSAPHNAPEGTVAHLLIEQGGDDGVGVYVDASTSVPLAINVLGYDRPSAGRSAAGATRYNGHEVNRMIPGNHDERDANVAEAIDLLRGADIFDQREASKAAAAGAEAKRKADYEASKLESLNRAKSSFEDALTLAALDGASAESAAMVQAALSAYETARRKYEACPTRQATQ